LNADDFYGREAFKLMKSFLCRVRKKRSEAGIVTYHLNKTLSENGKVNRGICTFKKNILGKNKFVNLVEHKEIEQQSDGSFVGLRDGVDRVSIDPESHVSMGLFGFTPDIFVHTERLLRDFVSENGIDTEKEFFITWVVMDFLKNGNSGKGVDMHVMLSKNSWFGMTYKEDREMAKKRIAELIKKGEYPNQLAIKKVQNLKFKN